MAETSQQPLALVIDDQEDILQIVTLAFQHEGWRVQTAHNGREGIEAVRRERPDLILADMMMPQMNGIEFCRKLVEEAMLDVPVLMISGVNENAKILGDFWEMPLRYRNFLHKPFSVDELLAAVRTILPRHLSKSIRPAAPKPAAPAPKPAAAPAPAKPAAPAASKPAATRAAPPFQPKAGRGFRILVIDDEPDIRTVLTTALGMFHVVASAGNGMEGIELVDQFGPDMIISDIKMPVMGGLETAEAIRKHPAYGGVPIFFLTGQTEADLPRQAYEAGCNLFLRKPTDPIQVLKCIDRFVQETGLKPGQFHKPAQRQGAPAAGAAPAPQAAPAPARTPAAPPANVRVLVIEAKADEQARLSAFFAPRGAEPPRIPGGPFDLIQAEEISQAMGNLSRWEPDVILYNPRLPRGLDAVAFGQMVRLAKLAKTPEIIFAGAEFYESEIEYSRANFRRGVLRTGAGEQEALRLLGEAVALARRNPAPKRTPFARIASEEAERRRVQSVQDEREARQREELRRRYANIQSFINEQMS